MLIKVLNARGGEIGGIWRKATPIGYSGDKPLALVKMAGHEHRIAYERIKRVGPAYPNPAFYHDCLDVLDPQHRHPRPEP